MLLHRTAVMTQENERDGVLYSRNDADELPAGRALHFKFNRAMYSRE